MRDFDPTAGEFISSGFLSRSRPGGALYDIGSIVGSVAGPLLGGIFGSDASSDASNAQQQSASAANALSKEQFDLTRADNAGLRARGDAAGNQLANLLGLNVPGQTPGAGFGSLTQQFTGANLQNEPGYQFGMQQGTQAVDRSAASRGGLYSGATLKALQRFGQDYGGTKYGEAFNRDQAQKNMTYNQLAGVAGTGQNATNQVNQAGQNYATQAGNNMMGAGNAAASGYVGSANAWTNAIGQGVGAYQQQNMLSSLMGGGRSAFAPAVVDDGYSMGLGSAYGGNRAGF